MPRRYPQLNNARSFMLGLISAVLAVFLLALLPVPYVIYKPGTAEATRPMVSIAGGNGEEQGEFLLTTVEVTFSNMFAFVAAGFNSNAQLYRKEDILRGRTRDEYASRQQFTMRASQSNAIEAAYHALHIPYQVKDTAILVTNTVEHMGADGVLLPGDELLKLNGKEIRKLDDVTASIEGMKTGEHVTISYRRGKQSGEADIELKLLEGVDPPRPGIGISYAVLQQVTSVDPAKQVNIKVDHIGGPSAGLMFALEIANQLTREDLTKGRIIAGTGEITPEGKVGPIGGISHKVVAADRKHAEVFFAPEANAEEAKRKASEIGSEMKIIPVHSIQDALHYLESLS